MKNLFVAAHSRPDGKLLLNGGMDSFRNPCFPSDFVSVSKETGLIGKPVRTYFDTVRRYRSRGIIVNRAAAKKNAETAINCLSIGFSRQFKILTASRATASVRLRN